MSAVPHLLRLLPLLLPCQGRLVRHRHALRAGLLGLLPGGPCFVRDGGCGGARTQGARRVTSSNFINHRAAGVAGLLAATGLDGGGLLDGGSGLAGRGARLLADGVGGAGRNCK
jgi:hypothetical protein